MNSLQFGYPRETPSIFCRNMKYLHCWRPREKEAPWSYLQAPMSTLIGAGNDLKSIAYPYGE
jgi:hypothetical protein